MLEKIKALLTNTKLILVILLIAFILQLVFLKNVTLIYDIIVTMIVYVYLRYGMMKYRLYIIFLLLQLITIFSGIFPLVIDHVMYEFLAISVSYLLVKQQIKYFKK